MTNQLQLPALADGETYAGAIGGKNGDVYHLVLLPGDNDPAPHSAQLEWAKSIGGDLPNKLESAMLFACAKEEFKPDWYWTNETHIGPGDQEDAGWAWCQYFGYGSQTYGHELDKLRARAVRRILISEPVAYAPVHPKHGPLWANTTDSPTPERLPRYPLKKLYAAPQPDRVTELTAEVERLYGWLAMLIDLYEDGSPCYSDPDNCSDFLGYAIHIEQQSFNDMCDWLNARDAMAGKEIQS